MNSNHIRILNVHKYKYVKMLHIMSKYILIICLWPK